jgi:hypothetical protein
MKRFIFISLSLFLLLSRGIIYAGTAIIDGPANVRDKPKGKVIISLYNGAVIFACPALYPEGGCLDGQHEQDGWYLVGIDAGFDKDDIIDRKRIRKNAEFYDSTGNKMGVTLETIEEDNIGYISGRGENYNVRIYAYTFEGNIWKATQEDLKQIEGLIASYFKALEKEDYDEAWKLKSIVSKAEFSKSDAIKAKFGLEAIRLISVEHIQDDLHCPSNLCFMVLLDIIPAPHSAWEKGLNKRLVDVIRGSDGQWRINGLNTGP